MRPTLIAMSLAALCASCSHKPLPATPGAAVPGFQEAPLPGRLTGGSQDLRDSMIPRATAFRMSGDYADNVAVTVDASGTLTYFPAPSDLTEASRPLDLGNGWWLNRQGIGPNSVFTRYTYGEYMQLPAPPTPGQLKAAIIPGARVTEMVRLPYPAGQAAGHLDAIRQLLREEVGSGE